jgi:alkylation response protein AidB-like acyl-CoA dehydrogenase
MDNQSADLQAFRAEVRDFLAQELPPDVRADVAAGLPLSRERQTDWQRRLQRRGWLAPGWPARWGGCDWSPRQHHVFDEQCVLADAPFVNPFGLFRAGPVILAFGTPEQQQRFLPGILDSSTWWCQGYSEPGAGSDLAALSLRAERHGDRYVLHGTKTWTTQAHLADWMFLLARTHATERPRDGISFFLVDLRSPGIHIRPIELLDHRPHVSEVHFEDVEVPLDQRIGAEGQGWACSAVVLGHERLQIAEVPQSQRLLRRLLALLRETTGEDGRPLAEHAGWRARVADAAAQLRAHAFVHRQFLEQAEGRPPGPEVSMLKLRGAELRQVLNDLIVEVLGSAALAYPGGTSAPLVQEFLYSRAATIYGGTNEIQRNILARQLLGAP